MWDKLRESFTGEAKWQQEKSWGFSSIDIQQGNPLSVGNTMAVSQERDQAHCCSLFFFFGGGGVSTKMAFLERGKNTVSSNREGRECQLFKCWKTPDAKHLESLEPTVTYKPSCWREATRPVAIWVVELLLQFGQKWSSGGPAIPKELPFGGCSQHSWTGYLLMVSHYTVAYSFHYTVAYSFHLIYFRYRPIIA